jgi:hypothetical protein
MTIKTLQRKQQPLITPELKLTLIVIGLFLICAIALYVNLASPTGVEYNSGLG